MLVVHGSRDVPSEARGGVLAIGNFDGVHRGHQAVLSDAVTLGRRLGAPAGALVFEPHPRSFFQPDKPLFRLSPLPRKLALFEALGLDMAAVLDFDAALAALSADAFVAEVLVGRFGVRHIFVGHDFQFGKGRQGSPGLLAARGREQGFGVTVVAAVADAAGVYSSSRIRAALAQGDVAAAAQDLGYRWRVSGPVVGGAQRGTGLGFPTANVRLSAGIDLHHGIYAVRVYIGTDCHAGAAYWGQRPTFDNGQPVLEVFLLDFDGDLYGREISVEFVRFLRPDARFDTADALARQMAEDVRVTRAALAELAVRDPIAGLPLAGC